MIESKYLYNLKEIFRSNGYFVEKTNLNYVYFAMRTFNKDAYVVIICDNYIHDISSKVNTEYIKKVISTDPRIPSDMKVHYLTVVLNDLKTKKFRAKNTIYINTILDKAKKYNVSRVFEKEVVLISKIVKDMEEINSIWNNKYGFVEKNYRPWMTYLIVAVTSIIFVFFNDKEAYGRANNLFSTREYYRLISYAFVHANVLHLLGNMGILLVTGTLLEKKAGAAKFLVIYLLSAVYGGILSMQHATGEFTSSVGASGAVYGILGAAIMTAIVKNERTDKVKLFEFSFKVFFLLLSGFLIAFTDNWCHLGGMICGIVCGLSFAICDKIEDNIKIIKMQ